MKYFILVLMAYGPMLSVVQFLGPDSLGLNNIAMGWLMVVGAGVAVVLNHCKPLMGSDETTSDEELE